MLCCRPEDRQKILEMLSREREQQADDSDDGRIMTDINLLYIFDQETDLVN